MIYTVITRVWSKTYRQMMTTDFDGVAFTTLDAAKAHADWATKRGSYDGGRVECIIKADSAIIATYEYKRGKQTIK